MEGRPNNATECREYKRRLKVLVLGWYGGKCRCCGEAILDFLTLDHVNGIPERLNTGIRNGNGRSDCACPSGNHLYLRIKKLGFENRPRDLQVLCFNCQWGKQIQNGFCPHHPKVDLRQSSCAESARVEEEQWLR